MAHYITNTHVWFFFNSLIDVAAVESYVDSLKGSAMNVFSYNIQNPTWGYQRFKTRLCGNFKDDCTWRLTASFKPLDISDRFHYCRSSSISTFTFTSMGQIHRPVGGWWIWPQMCCCSWQRNLQYRLSVLHFLIDGRNMSLKEKAVEPVDAHMRGFILGSKPNPAVEISYIQKERWMRIGRSAK